MPNYEVVAKVGDFPDRLTPALAVVGRLGIDNARRIVQRSRSRDELTIAAGIDEVTAAHIMAVLSDAGIDAERRPCELASPTVCWPDANAQFVTNWLYGQTKLTPGLCAHCGFDLRGGGHEACPECGAPCLAGSGGMATYRKPVLPDWAWTASIALFAIAPGLIVGAAVAPQNGYHPIAGAAVGVTGNLLAVGILLAADRMRPRRPSKNG